LWRIVKRAHLFIDLAVVFCRTVIGLSELGPGGERDARSRCAYPL
jgi:hypothetical protein